MKRGSPLSRVAAGLLLVAVVALLYAIVGLPLQSAYREANAAIGNARLALARLEDGARRQARIVASLDEFDGQALMIAGDTDGNATAALQSLFQEILETHRAELVSIEALPAVDVAAFRAIRLRVQFTAGHAGLTGVVRALEDGRPVVFLDNLTVSARSSRVVGVERPLDVRVELTAFRSGGAT